MKIKYVLISCLIILPLCWMAFTTSEKSQTVAEKYAFLVVEYEMNDFSYDTKELMFNTVVEGQTQKENIKATTKELYNEMNNRMISLAEKGYSLIDSDELILNPSHQNSKIRTKKTLIFKKVD